MKNIKTLNIFNIIENNNKYYLNLAKIIFNSQERINDFLCFYNENESIYEQLRTFRSNIINNRIETVIVEYIHGLEIQIHNKNWAEFHITLQELFLEPIPDWIHERIVIMLQEEVIDCNTIYKWYLNNQNIKAIITM